jgi:adenine-specific DNA-methyltransferase
MAKLDFEDVLNKELSKNPDFLSAEGEVLKDRVIDSAYKADRKLIELLLENTELKKKFFSEIKGYWVFNINDFVMFVQDKHFLNDSYTQYKNKIGLTIDGKFLNERKEVSLVWPFKDTILEGGMTKEDQKKKEIFFNEILAQDEIDKLLAPKVLTNWKRYTAKGEEEVKELKRDENGIIKENLIIKGNNLLALHTLKEQFRGKVKLIYIDPPYNTESSRFGYNDNFTNSTWLTFMKNRLEAAKELLSEEGSIYVNIDYNQVHYLKVLMDDIFPGTFQREIVWRIGWLSGYKTAANNYIRNHDTILFYTKSKKNFLFNKEKAYTKFSEYNERFNTESKKEIQKILSVKGFSKQEIDEFIDFVSKIGLPEKYPLEDTWNSSIYDKLNSIAVVSFSGEKVSKMLNTEELKGQKSEALLKRIIEISTNKGDIVMDYHLGTGTTAAVAHKLGRQFVGVEQMYYIKDMAVERLKKVITGQDTSGISKDVNWKGGGDFLYCELMKYNESFVEEIENAKDVKSLLKIWEQMKEKAFLKHNFEMKEFEKNIEEFKKLDLKKQKQVLFSVLDKNQLYVNYSEIEDKKFKVEKKDKEINKEFYGTK